MLADRTDILYAVIAELGLRAVVYTPLCLAPRPSQAVRRDMYASQRQAEHSSGSRT